MANGRTRLLPESGKRRNGAIDQKRLVELAISKRMKVYGLVCVAIDPNASPRKIKEVKSEYLIRLDLVRDGDQVLGVHLGKIPLVEFLSKSAKRNGVTDLEAVPPGNDSPDRALRSG